MEEKGQCQIRRLGILKELHLEKALIEVEGKLISVPIARVSSAVRVGDGLLWDAARRIWSIEKEEG